MCVCHCIFSVVLRILFVVIIFTRLKSIFGIKAIIGFRGAPLWLRVWIEYVISLVIVGDMWY
jgi:hypothetical protein